MGAVLLRIAVALKGFWLRIWPMFCAWFAITSAKQLAKAPVRVAMMAAYAVMLLAVMTGLTGMGLTTVVSNNPMTGISGGVMFLVCSCFPIHYAFGTMLAYLAFKMTCVTAIRKMNQTIMWLFGA